MIKKKEKSQGIFSSESNEELNIVIEGKTHKEIFDMGISHGNVKMVQLGLDAGVDPAAFNNLAIREASEDGYQDVVELLLNDARVDPSANNYYAVHLAAMKGHKEVMASLLRHHMIDPTAKDFFGIQWAADYGNLDVVKLLLKDGRGDPTSWDNWAIRRAAKYGLMDLVELLLNDKRVWTTLTQKLRQEYSELINRD